MANITLDKDTLHLSGDWSLHEIETISSDPLKGIILPTYPLKIDGNTISALDSAVALLIDKIETQLKTHQIHITRQGFNEQQKILRFNTLAPLATISTD